MFNFENVVLIENASLVFSWPDCYVTTYQSFEMLAISPFILISKTHCVVLLLYALTKRRQTKAKKIGLPFKCKQNKAIHFLDISRWLCPMVLNDRFSQLLISFTVRNTCWVVSILIVLPILTAQFQASTPSRHGFVYIQSNIILYKNCYTSSIILIEFSVKYSPKTIILAKFHVVIITQNQRFQFFIKTMWLSFSTTIKGGGQHFENVARNLVNEWYISTNYFSAEMWIQSEFLMTHMTVDDAIVKHYTCFTQEGLL